MEPKVISLLILFCSHTNNFIFDLFLKNLSEESKGDEEETPKVSEEEKTPESEEVAAQDESSGEKQ